MSDEAPRLSGVFPMIVTPFRDDGALDAPQLPPLVSYVLAEGCQGVSGLGLGGEAGALSTGERLRVAESIINAASGMPVIVGCSSGETEVSISLGLHAAEVGAAAIMVAPPPRPELSEPELLEHFTRVAAAVRPLPVMVQDAPAFIGVELGSRFVRMLIDESPNVRYAKTEAVPAADRVAELVALGSIGVFGGHGALYLLDVLQAGATGVIPGCDLAGLYAQLWRSHSGGRHDEARVLFTAMLPLIVEQFQSLDYFVAASKLVLTRLGVLRSPSVRSGVRISGLGERLLLDHARAAGLELPSS